MGKGVMHTFRKTFLLPPSAHEKKQEELSPFEFAKRVKLCE